MTDTKEVLSPDVDGFSGWWNRRRCNKAARLILKATQGGGNLPTIQKCGKDLAGQVFNLARFIQA